MQQARNARGDARGAGQHRAVGQHRGTHVESREGKRVLKVGGCFFFFFHFAFLIKSRGGGGGGQAKRRTRIKNQCRDAIDKETVIKSRI